MIIKLPLAPYLNGHDNLLDYFEDELFNKFESFYNYIDINNLSRYYDYDQAKQWLLGEGYTKEEIDLFNEDYRLALKQALADAKDQSYISKWQADFIKLLYKQIQVDVIEDTCGYNLVINNNYEATDFSCEINDEDEENFFDFYNATKIDTEYIDYYGTIGNYDDWFNCFKDCPATSDLMDKIDLYRQDEAEKINNFERANLELKPLINRLNSYIDKYIDQEPHKTKIKRQITALKNVIKNAA